MSKEEEGHNYTFHIPEVPWQKEYHGEPEEVESKPYLEEVRQLLMYIMANRHKPKFIWECASEALRLIDTNEEN